MCLPPARPARRATDRHGSQPRCKSEPARGCRFSRRVMNRAPKKSEPPGGKRSIPCDLWHPNLVRQMRDQGRRIDYLECRGGLERIRVFKPCPTELRNAGNCRPDYRTGVIRAGNSKLNRIRLLKSTKRQKPHCKEYGHVYLKNLEREARAALQKGLGGACDATRQAGKDLRRRDEEAFGKTRHTLAAAWILGEKREQKKGHSRTQATCGVARAFQRGIRVRRPTNRLRNIPSAKYARSKLVDSVVGSSVRWNESTGTRPETPESLITVFCKTPSVAEKIRGTRLLHLATGPSLSLPINRDESI